MKRANKLLEPIADAENLRIAFYKASKGKRHSPKVLGYQESLDDNLLLLRKQILSGKVDVGSYHFFKIYDPKEREICAPAFPEQVLHHSLMNVCHDVFEKKQIYDSYASRPGKGVHAALKRGQYFSQHNRYFLKLDVRKFFASVPHETLISQLSRTFKEKHLVSIFTKVIHSYRPQFGKGLPIGNLSSQYFANHYLSELDHFIKEKLKIRAYVRYMDDMLLCTNDKSSLKRALSEINHYVVGKLKMELKAPVLNTCKQGVPFLGYILYPRYIRLSQRSKKRFIKKMNYLLDRFYSGDWDDATCQRRVLPLLDFIKQAETKNLKKSLNLGELG